MFAVQHLFTNKDDDKIGLLNFCLLFVLWRKLYMLIVMSIIMSCCPLYFIVIFGSFLFFCILLVMNFLILCFCYIFVSVCCCQSVCATYAIIFKFRLVFCYISDNCFVLIFQLQMLGYDISWAAFNIIEVMTSSKFTHKVS